LERRELVLRRLAGRAQDPLRATHDLGGRVDAVQRPRHRYTPLRSRRNLCDHRGPVRPSAGGRRVRVLGRARLVATNCVNAFSYGYDKLRFIKPTFIGDTIYTIRTNLDKFPKYAELGLCRASYEVFKGEGELVLYCEHLQTVKYRNAASVPDRGAR
jgi:hypothetical protein